MYCVKCKNKTETSNVQNVVSKNGRPMLHGKCVLCGTIKTQFGAMKKGGDPISSLNSVTRKIKRQWPTFPGEMHLPGMIFAGPETNLDARLTSIGAYN
jgi:hypothetical protein